MRGIKIVFGAASYSASIQRYLVMIFEYLSKFACNGIEISVENDT